MFDFSKFAVAPSMTFAQKLNTVVGDLNGHGVNVGIRFVGRGPETAYVKGVRFGVCCSAGPDGTVVYFHPSRKDKEAWELSATDEGCRQLCEDADMEEERVWLKPDVATAWGDVDASLYDVVNLILRRAA